MSSKNFQPKPAAKNQSPSEQIKDSKRPAEVRYEKLDGKKVKVNKERSSSSQSESESPSNQAQNSQNMSSSSSDQQQNSSQSQSSKSPQRPTPIIKQPQPSPPWSQFQPIGIKFLFQAIIQHLLKNLPTSDRKARLDYLLLLVRQCVPLKEIMSKFDNKDLMIVAQHKKILQILDKNFHLLLQKTEYLEFKKLNYKKLILSIYDSLGIEINFAAVAKSLQRQLKQLNSKKVFPLIRELIFLTKKEFKSNNIQLSQQDELIFKTIEEKSIQKMPFVDPFNFQINQESRYDNVSKYGVFASKEEQCEFSRQGIFNYRLHRTMAIIQKMGIMNPQENIKAAKNMAIFLIKLTDHHLQQVLQKTMKTAAVTSRQITNVSKFDQVNYLSKSNFRSKISMAKKISLQDKKESETISRLKYPNQMKLYHDLRSFELIQEENLCNVLQEDIYKHFSIKKKRLNKEERSVIEYFSKKPNTIQFITKLKEDTERQPCKERTGVQYRLAIKPRHVRSFLQNHQYYRNHQMLWRFNVVY